MHLTCAVEKTGSILERTLLEIRDVSSRLDHILNPFNNYRRCHTHKRPIVINEHGSSTLFKVSVIKERNYRPMCGII